MNELFARCASGFEPLLADELRKLHIKRIRPLKGGVAFFGSCKDAYRVCLWSRVASRVLLILARVKAEDADALYCGVASIDWAGHLKPSSTISVYAHGTSDTLRDTRFTALKTKDAICDTMREAYGARPDVRTTRPDVVIDVALRDQKATISLDLSGEPLHRRGYRAPGIQSSAPLKESLAAAIVLASGWEELAKAKASFIDPLCGSGTLAIEAAMIAADRAPGLARDYWGFTGWAGFDAAVWDGLIEDADERFARGLDSLPPIFASDSDALAVTLAQENAKRAGLAGHITFAVKPVAQLGESVVGSKPGLVAANPPYGERIGSKESLERLYQDMAESFSKLPDGWRIAIITSDESLGFKLGMPPVSKQPFFNGRIETELLQFVVCRDAQTSLEVAALPSGELTTVRLLEKNSEQFAARFRKVAKERRKWARKNAVSCYRIYDADLPDYAVAVDAYEPVPETSMPDLFCPAEKAGQSDRGRQRRTDLPADAVPGQADRRYLVVSEYKAPKQIDEDRARKRFNDALALAAAIEGIPAYHAFPKERRREKGGGQYQAAGGSHFVTYTEEAGFLFEVDLGGYLDTGLFLDHRATRKIIGEMAEGKRFLNLFAYTGTATVYAAGGGALETTTVDLSNTYLAWAKRNMAANGFSGSSHRFFRDDVLDWVGKESETGKSYDLIFVDPPTFSNSKSMGKSSWSVERDHVGLLSQVAKLLAPGGTIVFSCNLRNFVPKTAELKRVGLTVSDITATTIPEDFKRSPKIHHCYLISSSESS